MKNYYVVTPEEVARRVRMCLEHAAPERLLIGAMVEVPALLYDLDSLVREADFISVGSNDLLQFMTATDRGNTRVAGRFDPLSRPFLRALRQIVRAAGAARGSGPPRARRRARASEGSPGARCTSGWRS